MKRFPPCKKDFRAHALQEEKQKSKWAILFAQFTDVMIIILVIAAGIFFFEENIQMLL